MGLYMKITIYFVVTLSVFLAFNSTNLWAAGPTESRNHSLTKVAGNPAAPDFNLEDQNGNFIRLSDYKGQVVIVNFWATWCPPCLKEIPDFIALQKAYGNQDFQIIGIALDDEEAVLKYANETGLNYPTMVVETEGIALAKRYGNDIGALPYTAIINSNGEISNTITGELSKKRAKEILKEHGINL